MSDPQWLTDWERRSALWRALHCAHAALRLGFTPEGARLVGEALVANHTLNANAAVAQGPGRPLLPPTQASALASKSQSPPGPAAPPSDT